MKKQRHGMGGWYAPRGKGRGITIVREAIAYQGDECILWPMSKDWHGYGTFGFEGGQYYAHRYVCEQVPCRALAPANATCANPPSHPAPVNAAGPHDHRWRKARRRQAGLLLARLGQSAHRASVDRLAAS
jgi:hypothetical protein